MTFIPWRAETLPLSVKKLQPKHAVATFLFFPLPLSTPFLASSLSPLELSLKNAGSYGSSLTIPSVVSTIPCPISLGEHSAAYSLRSQGSILPSAWYF